MNRLKDFNFAQLNLTSFLNDLIGHAKESIHMFNKFLGDDAKTRLFELRDKFDVNLLFFLNNVSKKIAFSIQEYEKNLKQTTDTLEDLKFVLRTIAEIQNQSDVIEAKINDVQDKYNLLECYNYKVRRNFLDVLSRNYKRERNVSSTENKREDLARQELNN